ncbi:hypothetical protein CCR75_007290 [Bremia lactucae]|uniref:Uncharacterized protein n=1 Tax=Bremia lactucae TaxID=4779 RepID=A0A976IH09_BRELC|nr:hypothetical protein CCR75_007290 [Bremia lactucae]
MEVTLKVVFIDGWKRVLQFLPNGECMHSAIPSKQSAHTLQYCVDLDTDLEANFSTAFDVELRRAQSNQGFARSAATNSLGHQKTPQFIVAVVKCTVINDATESFPNIGTIGEVTYAAQGGTTDVGLHTGGRARDTCWALVQEVIARNLCCGRGLFDKAMVALKLSLLQQAVHQTKTAFQQQHYTVDLLESKYKDSTLQRHFEILRFEIDAFVDALNRQTAALNMLPGKETLSQLNLACNYKVASPRRDNISNSSESSEKHELA